MKTGGIMTVMMTFAMSLMFVDVVAAEVSAPQARILRIKTRVSTRSAEVKLSDMVDNASILTADEAAYEVMQTPAERDVTMSLVDVAYSLQRFPSLMDVRLRGSQQVTIARLNDMRYVDQTKQQILAYLSANAPWKEWQIELMFDANDETVISRVGPFKRIEVMPYDTRGMIGVVDFHISFYDKDDKLIKKMNLSPKILRRANAYVMRDTRSTGHVVQKSDLKMAPVWIGGDQNRYVTDENDCVGKELARRINAGDFINQPDLVNPVCAKRGQMIWVTSKSGGLSVKLGVQAIQGGRLGDTIRAVNRSTRKELNVVLTGDREAVFKL
jgi:flagella basal body P-ring formation protein FlgA